MFTALKRVFKFAITDFSRNKGANFAAIFVLVVTISLVTSLFLFRGTAQFLISKVQEKVDVTAYFKKEATEEDILNVKSEISNFSSEIQDIKYISREEALQKFTEKHKNDPDLMKALEEIGDNPFLASLNIKMEFPFQYEKVSLFLQADQFSNVVEKVDYYQKKPIIDKVFSTISTINQIGIILSGILILISILVVFNTIKLAIQDSKEEINAMKLVGAPNWFIRGPFIIQGATCGLFACLISLAIFASITYFSASSLEALLPGFNIFNYFVSNFWIILSIQIGAGVILGVVSSYIVVRKYLNV